MKYEPFLKKKPLFRGVLIVGYLLSHLYDDDFSDEGVAVGRRWRHSLEDLVTVVPPMGASTSGCPDQGPASQL